MNFQFPRSKVQFTSIPKTGCTSVLSFFTALERHLEIHNKFLNQNTSIFELDYSFADQLASIHSHNSPLWKYQNRSSMQKDNHERLKMVVLRNPYNRFTSFWFNKIVLATDPSYFKLAIELLPPSNNLDFRSIQISAQNFLLNLTPSRNLDPHVRPQHLFINGKTKYDLSMETNNIQNIPSEVSRISPRYRAIRDLEIPKLNFTDSHIKTQFLNPEIVRLIEQTYNSDFKLLKELDLNYAKPEIDFVAHNEIDLRERNAKLEEFMQRAGLEETKLFTINDRLKRNPKVLRIKRFLFFIKAILRRN